MHRGLLAMLGLSILSVLGSTGHAQGGYTEQPGLDIPDSVVIPGHTTYERITRGAKKLSYFGHAFPVERKTDVVGPTSVTTLPPLASKALYPTPVRHGGLRATTVAGHVEHYGSVYASGLHLRDWHGYLASGEGELGGGLGHTDGAVWHREAVTARARKVISWRSSYRGAVTLENGRTGVWGMNTNSNRDYYNLGLKGGGETTLFNENQFNLGVSGNQRGVSSPDESASEQMFSGRLGWQRTNGRFWVKGRAAWDVVRTDRDAGTTGTANALALSAEAWTRLEENFGGAAGVTVYSADYLEGDSLRAVRPSVSVWARIMRLKFNARLTSSIQRFGIWEAYQSNQMLEMSTPLRMPFNNVDLDVNGEISLGGWNTLTGGMKLLLIDDYPVWKRTAEGEPFSMVLDERARSTQVYGRYQHIFRLGSIDALALWRQHSLESSDEPVPFMPDWEFHLGGSYPTKYWGLQLSPSFELIGSRHYIAVHTGQADTYEDLDPYYLFNLEAVLPTRRGWDVTISLRNLLNQSYEEFDGVSSPGFHLRLGAQRTW